MRNYYDDVKDNKRERSREEQIHYEQVIKQRRKAYYASTQNNNK